MFHRPQFKPQFRVEVVPGEGVFLLSELHQAVLQGSLYEIVAPCLDGRPVEEICARLRGQATPAHVFYTLAQLEKRGYLAEADDGRPAAESALWAEQQVDPAVAARRLAETPVAIRAVGARGRRPAGRPAALDRSAHGRRAGADRGGNRQLSAQRPAGLQ